MSQFFMRESAAAAIAFALSRAMASACAISAAAERATRYSRCASTRSAVDLEQRFAAPDGLAGRAHMQLLDPALEFRIDDANAAFVGRHGADRAHGVGHGAQGRDLG